MPLRTLLPLLLCLLSFSSQAAPLTFSNEADFIALGGEQSLYDFETASGFPSGSYNPANSLIGGFDAIQFNAITIIPGRAPTSGTQAMSGANGTYSTANLDFTGSSRRITGFGFYGLDLVAGESIRVSANYQFSNTRITDIRLGSATDLTPIYFATYDANDSIRSLSLLGIDDNGINRAWYIDNLRLTTTAAVPLPSALPLFIAGLLLLGRFKSKHANHQSFHALPQAGT